METVLLVEELLTNARINIFLLELNRDRFLKERK